MHFLSKFSRDQGSATIEFIVVGIGIITPLVYIALAVLTLHSASFAANSAAWEAARAFMTSDSVAQGNRSAIRSVQQAYVDHDVSGAAPTVSVVCTNGPCLSPGSLLTIEVESYVALPLIPRWSDGSVIAMPVSAEVTVLVDEFRQAG